MSNPFDQFDEGQSASSNPFDQFDESASNPFSQFDGKETPKAKKSGASIIPGAESYTQSPPKPVEEDLGTKSKGVGEAALTALTGSVAPFLGLMGGTVQSVRQAAQGELPDWKKNVEDIAEATTYQPRTETGQHIVEKVVGPVGEAMQALGPLAPHFMVGEPVTGTKMLFGKGKKVEEAATTSGRVSDAIAKKAEAADIRKAEVAPEQLSLDLGPVVSEAPPPAKGMVRLYHGGVDVAPGDRRWMTPDPEYAAGYARKSGEAGRVQYVDVPQDSPFLTKAYDDTYMQQKAPFNMFEADENVTAGLRPLQQEGAGLSLKPSEAGAGPLGPETRGSLANRRQSPLDFENGARDQRQMTFTPEGVLDHPTNEALFQARDMREEALRQQLDAGATKVPYADLEQTQTALKTERELARKQMEIDDTPYADPNKGELYGAQYGTESGMGRVDENGMPIRADLSMEAQNLQNPLQRNLWGDELGPALDQTRSLTEALDTLERTPFKGDARDVALERLGAPTGARSFNERTRGQGGAISEDIAKKMASLGIKIVPTERGFNAVNKEGAVVGRLESNITPEQGAMLRERFPNERNDASIDIVKVSDDVKGQGVGTALYSEWAKAHGGMVAPSGVTTQAAWNQWKRNYPAQVDTFVKGEAQRLQDGANPQQVFSNIKDPDIANRVKIAAYEPGTVDPFKSQRGHIRVPGSDGAREIADNPFFKKAIGHLLPENITPEQVVERAVNSPDFDQNRVQKGFNFGTKGGDYMTAKSEGNVVIKQTVDTFKKAEDVAAANKRNIVHEVYTPTWRKLNKQEFTDAWDTLKQMEASKIRLSDEELMSAGLNGKQRDAIKMHQEVMDSMVPKINEALDAAGLTHINPEAAYVAAKASGNFRRVMLKEVDGELRVVGAIGDRTRQGLEKQVKQFQEHFPDTIPGEQQVYKGSSMHSTGFDDVLSFLSSQDPHIQEFIKRSRELNYAGSRTHLMDKKGVPGMAGNKPWEDPYVNAKEGVEAQVRYLNTMLEWAEKAKADAHVGQFLDNPDLQKAQPNAAKYASRYRDMALGRNPTAMGKGIESLLAGVTDSTDGWSSYVGDAATMAKKLTNYKLLTLRPGYLISNLMQAGRTMPELAQFLAAKGARDTGFGISNMVKGMWESAKPNPEGVFKEALDYANSHHVYASDMLEDANAVRQSFGHVVQTAANAPASVIEQGTRKMMFMGMVDLLHKNGVKPEEGLFQAAHKLTDMGMNRYTQQDAPLGVGALGPVGKMPYNLMSYKFNELSRFAMLAREAFNNPTEIKAYKPVVTALLAQVAFAGLSGAMFFQEADWLVRQFSNLLDKPTSLTKMLLDNGDHKVVGPVTVKDLHYGGLSAATQIDFSNSMGMGPVLGDVSNPVNLLMPGATAAGQMVGSTYNLGKGLLTDPMSPANYANAARFVVDALPGGGLFERQLFSKQTPRGEEMGTNRNTMEAQPIRNKMDVFAKQGAMTGLNEANTKKGLYENKQIEDVLAEKQKAVLSKMRDEFYESGKVRKETIAKYAKVEGSVESLDSQIQQMVLDQNISSDARDKIKAAAAQGLAGVGKMKRRFH